MNPDTRPAELHDYPIVLQLPILWGDLDAYGHVNNLVYLKWFEAARAVYGSRVGVQLTPQEDGDSGAVLASVSCKFLRQLTYPGTVFTGVRVTRISIGSVTLDFRITDGQLGVPVAEGTCDAVLYDFDGGQPVPVPDHIRAAVENLEGKSFDL